MEIKDEESQIVFDNVWAGNYATFARVHEANDIYACGLNHMAQLGECFFANMDDEICYSKATAFR